MKHEVNFNLIMILNHLNTYAKNNNKCECDNETLETIKTIIELLLKK